MLQSLGRQLLSEALEGGEAAFRRLLGRMVLALGALIGLCGAIACASYALFLVMAPSVGAPAAAAIVGCGLLLHAVILLVLALVTLQIVPSAPPPPAEVPEAPLVRGPDVAEQAIIEVGRAIGHTASPLLLVAIAAASGFVASRRG
jgi:hypothetical protein